ncbi:MAG: hypothetical protein JWM58_401 [Rhizobium sp.]|nr:hypothetical protein [Rhizobium sp.]
MFQRSALLALAATLLLTVTAFETSAGERMRRHHHVGKPTKVVININFRHRARAHRQANTYSGNVVVYHRRNVGAWSYGTVSMPSRVVIEHPGAKIIDIGSLAGNSDCRMEHRVCVIRP